MYYNFWQDAANPRGVIRRTASLEAYMRAATASSASGTEQAQAVASTENSKGGDAELWEVVLDIDALGAAEGQSWVYKGQTPLDIPFYGKELR
jgi:prolyl oligopeptidase